MKKVYSSEEIIGLLRRGDVLLAQGKSLIEACRELGVSDAPYYRWRKAYGGLKVDQASKKA